MSAVSSQLSFRSSAPWKLNSRVLNIMDSIYAIAFGLGLRTLVDAVSQDFRLTGSLIGLWEGVITLHFLKKMPKSSDPYIAFGVRLFIDFLVTESIERLVLVLIWTAFGMVLADVAPGIWDEVGFKRVWRHFRRDLYTIYDKIPKVAFFPPPRTVRFLPSREPSIISPSITASQDTPIAVVPPSSSAPSEPLRRRVPGYYPGDYSDTDTDRGSIIRNRPSPRTEVNDALGTNHYRLSTMPTAYSASDLDEADQSSAVSSSDSTEMGDPPSFNHDGIPDMEGEEEQALVDIKEADPTTPQQKPMYIPMPPTPSDSAARWDLHRDVVEDVLHGRPPVLPDIPDSVEDAATSDGWEKIQRGELDEDKPPTPPAKDRPVGGSNVPIPIPVMIPSSVLPAAMMNTGSTSANPFDIDYSHLDTSSDPSATTAQRRESRPPPYVDDYDEMYYNPPPSSDNKTAADNDLNVNEHVQNTNNNDHDNDYNDFANVSSGQTGNLDLGDSTNHWASGLSASFDISTQAQADALKEGTMRQVEEEAKRKTEEDEKLQKEEKIRNEKEMERLRNEEERVQKEKEAERVRMEEEIVRMEEERVRMEEERVRKEEEEKVRKEADKKRKEKEERQKKEDEDAALRKKKQEETAAAEEKKKKEEAEVEQKRKDEAEAEQKRKAEAEQKRKDEDEAEQKRKDEDEAEQKRKAEAEQKRKDEVEVEQKRKDEAEQKGKDEAEQKRKAEAEQKRKDEAEQKRKDDDAERKKMNDEAEKKRREEEAKQGEDTKERVPSPGEAEVQEKLKTTLPPGDSVEEESTQSETTVPPEDVAERLERMMILRAQMVEPEKRLDQYKKEGLDEQSVEVKAVERTLRKYRRQAGRRYAAVEHRHEEDSNIVLDRLHPKLAEMVLEEKLEQLLNPTSRSIEFVLTIGKSKEDAKKQKPIVATFLETYNLIKYTTENENNSKIRSIEISEENFAEWLTGYRAKITKRDSGEDDGGIW
ncbi:hypothetical protein BYT27DRAFT_7131235 [Phlegmacium glaucopus]|nr:hypothetical protein BYT27DRAFT_7131235 [Phlegmacium glaucopus]